MLSSRTIPAFQFPRLNRAPKRGRDVFAQVFAPQVGSGSSEGHRGLGRLLSGLCREPPVGQFRQHRSGLSVRIGPGQAEAVALN